jgi:hypothetical protein
LPPETPMASAMLALTVAMVVVSSRNGKGE